MNIAALSTSTPVVGLGYSYKFQGGFEMFGVPECALSLKDIKKDDITGIINKILNLFENKDKIKQKLEMVNKNRENLII